MSTQKNIINSMVGFNVSVNMANQQAVVGELAKVDQHGVLVLTRNVTSEDEIKEKIVVFVPHKNIEIIYSQEYDNKTMINLDVYNEMFGG